MKTIKYLLLLAVLAVAASAVTLSVPLGKTVVLSLSANGGTPPFTYQWKKAGVDIPGATAATYTIPSFSLADVGVYTCTVSNSIASVLSDQGILAGPKPPTKPIVEVELKDLQPLPL